jgi:uncharacterized cupin superfamily protein
MEQTDAGQVATGEGWFVVHVRDAAWVRGERFGDGAIFEGDAARFAQVGYTLAVLAPGQPNGLYHRESNQEDFLVLAGECLLLVEGEERRLGAWDFVHCPAGTEHVFVGAGEGPCVIFMAGARTNARDTVYVRSAVALRHGAGVERETGSSREAYAPFGGWRPGAPASWDGLPWELR